MNILRHIPSADHQEFLARKVPPKVRLSNISYVCLKMLLNPGKPASWYLKELELYRFSARGPGKFCAYYFNERTRSDYAGRLYKNHSTNPRVGSWMLTDNGWCMARQAAKIIGLSEEQFRALGWAEYERIREEEQRHE